MLSRSRMGQQLSFGLANEDMMDSYCLELHKLDGLKEDLLS